MKKVIGLGPEISDRHVSRDLLLNNNEVTAYRTRAANDQLVSDRMPKHWASRDRNYQKIGLTYRRPQPIII